MNMLQRKLQRARQEQLLAASAEYAALRDALAQAYAVFNRTDDPALLEASILEIGALQRRCDGALRTLKSINGDPNHVHSAHSRNSAHRRDRSDLADAETASQAYQMGL